MSDPRLLGKTRDSPHHQSAPGAYSSALTAHDKPVKPTSRPLAAPLWRSRSDSGSWRCHASITTDDVAELEQWLRT